jgi:TonB family protein
MAYALAVSGVALLAGLGAERALERLDLPTRGVWMSAMLLGVLLPAGALLRAPLPPAPLAAGAAPGVDDLAFAGVSTLTALPPAPRMTLDGALLAGWAIASLLFALSLAWSALSLERARRRWRRVKVAGERAWISERTGPAVVGFLRPEIVLPAWVLDWDPALRRLIVAHEREHVRAGDGRLLLAGLLLLCAAPWNLALWWQWRRLKQAVETDCDRRVLATAPDVRRYGRLLLEVAERTKRHALPMAAFAESRSTLERRIRMMTSRGVRNRAGWALAVAVPLAAAPAALLALPAPAPVGVDAVRGVVAGWVASADSPDEVREAPLRRYVAVRPAIRPALVPASAWHGDTALLEIAKPARAATRRDTIPARAVIYEVAQLDNKPELRNASQIQAMLSRVYPRMLQDAGIGGTTMVRYVITPEGRVDPSTVEVVSTTHAQFGEASTKVVEQFAFTPGIYHGKPVYVAIMMPITWAPPTRPATGAPVGAPPGASQAGASDRIPTPALLAIREIIGQRYPDFAGKATGTRKVLLVVVHPDARIEHTSLEDGYMDPYKLRESNLVPGVTGDRIDRVDVMTSPDLASIAKDLNSVIWVTLKS